MNRHALAALAATLTLAACGGDAAAPGPQLSPPEARGLALSMAGLASGYGSSNATQAGVRTSAASASPISWTFKAELPCAAGGTVTPDLKVSGDLDVAGKSLTLELTGSEAFRDCAHVVDGQAITVNGTLAFTGHVPVVAGKPGTLTLSEKGSFTWSKGDGVNGSCTVDFTGTVDPVSRKTTLTGTFCGRNLS